MGTKNKIKIQKRNRSARFFSLLLLWLWLFRSLPLFICFLVLLLVLPLVRSTAYNRANTQHIISYKIPAVKKMYGREPVEAEESIYNLIPKTPERLVKPDRYRSKFKETVKVEQKAK